MLDALNFAKNGKKGACFLAKAFLYTKKQLPKLENCFRMSFALILFDHDARCFLKAVACDAHQVNAAWQMSEIDACVSLNVNGFDQVAHQVRDLQRYRILCGDGQCVRFERPRGNL